MDYCFFIEKLESASEKNGAVDDGDGESGGADPLKKMTALIVKESGCGSLSAYPWTNPAWETITPMQPLNKQCRKSRA